MAKKFRITNTTHKVLPPGGHALDFEGKYFHLGRHIVIECDVLPDIIHEWASKNMCLVQNALDGETVAGGDAFAGGVIAGPKIDSRIEDEELEHDEIGFDPAAAIEANLPKVAAGAHMPPNGRETGARVAPALEENSQGGYSPLPGERARSVDESDKFTIRAPRASGPGVIMKP